MAVSINEALNLIYKTTEPINRFEAINTLTSNHRIVAKDIYATKSLPRFDNSAMDGYAIKLSSSGETIACEKEILYAGAKEIPILGDNKTIKIMTGAVIPINCEAVVPFENVVLDVNENIVAFPDDIKLNANIRMAGEELKNGEKCIMAGDTINSYTIGLLASQGLSNIEVIEKPKVTILSSGDELRDFRDEELGDYELYNSNSPMFYARATELGCDTNIIDHCNDDIQGLEYQISKAILDSDILITSGGASSGDKDLTKEAFLNAGMKMIFDKIEIKPGKPTAIGKINDTFIVILPGNPLAAMVNFELFIVPLISKLKGSNVFYHQVIEAKLADDINIKAGKQTAVLGNYNGNIFHSLKKQSPNMVSILKDANSMLITTAQVSKIEKNRIVKIIRLDSAMSIVNERNIFSD